MAADTYVYPDVMVVCGGFAVVEGHRDMIVNPPVVVEVLSESTERWDRSGKFAQYQRVASLREYVLVSQEAMRVEWFTRQLVVSGGDGAGGSLPVGGVGADLQEGGGGYGVGRATGRILRCPIAESAGR